MQIISPQKIIITNMFLIQESNGQMQKLKAEDPTNKYYGLQGYLATLRTLRRSYSLLVNKRLGAGWIGASDASVEGRVGMGYWP